MASSSAHTVFHAHATQQAQAACAWCVHGPCSAHAVFHAAPRVHRRAAIAARRQFEAEAAEAEAEAAEAEELAAAARRQREAATAVARRERAAEAAEAAAEAARKQARAELVARAEQLRAELARRRAEGAAAASRRDQARQQTREEAEMAAMLQAKLQVLLLGGSDVLAQTAELRAELHGVAAHNKAQLAASLRGVELLQGPEGADPKLLAMSKLHMVGEVLGALFERLQKRDAKQARAHTKYGGQPGDPSHATPCT